MQHLHSHHNTRSQRGQLVLLTTAEAVDQWRLTCLSGLGRCVGCQAWEVCGQVCRLCGWQCPRFVLHFLDSKSDDTTDFFFQVKCCGVSTQERDEVICIQKQCLGALMHKPASGSGWAAALPFLGAGLLAVGRAGMAAVSSWRLGRASSLL